MFDLYLITPERSPAEILAKTEVLLRAAPPGRVALQLRAKHLPAHERRALGHALRALTHELTTPLLINADLRLVHDVAADGVQLPEAGPSVEQARRALGNTALIGASRHGLAGVREAALAGASFATLSPIHAVADKGAPLGLAGFAAIAREGLLPLLALGGVTAAHASDLVRARAHGLAVIRALFDSWEPEPALHALLSAIDLGRQAAGAGGQGRA